VQIDNNGVSNSTVNLNTSVTIESLNVSANDTLNFNTGRDITLANDTLVNNGAINMNSTGASTDLTSTGTGEIGANVATTGTQLHGVMITAGSQFIQSTGADILINNGVTNEGNWSHVGLFRRAGNALHHSPPSPHDSLI